MRHIIHLFAAVTCVLPAASQEVAELTATDASTRDSFGSALAIRGGNILAGAPFAIPNGSNSGAAYVHVGMGSTWTQQAKLLPTDGAAQDLFGTAVAVTSDTALVSSPRDEVVSGSNNRTGSAYVFRRSGTTWSQEAKLIASDGAAGDSFGTSVALDVNTAVVGTPFDGDAGPASGSVYVFTRSGTVWSQQAKITPADGAPGDVFGQAVAVQGDTLVVGAHRDDDMAPNSGSVYVFIRTGTSWSQQAKLGASDPAPELGPREASHSGLL